MPCCQINSRLFYCRLFFVNLQTKINIAMQSQKKVSFHTLGCKLNFSETSTIAREFEHGGYARTQRTADADICIVNTCSVTEHADKKCRNLIRKIHRENPDAVIAVTGCYAQLKPEEIASIEGVGLVVSNKDKGSIFEKVAGLGNKIGAEVYSCDTSELTNFFAAFSTGDRTRAFLKVQDGCDYKCSYCTIHYARGSSRNMPIEGLVREAEKIAAGGQKEIVVTGVNTGDFGRTTGEKFIDLLCALDNVEGIERYRISSIEPNLLTDEIIEFCAASSKFQHHFHVPLQNGSDKILGLMRRRYTADMFRKRIESVKRNMPDAFIGIDVIVGFPCETEEDFKATYSLLESLTPAYLHIFPFSERSGTPAVGLSGKVRPEIKAERARILGELCGNLSRLFYDGMVGKESFVLFEGRSAGGMMHGYTGNYIKCIAPYDKSLINKICKVKLCGIGENGTMNVTLI